MEKSHKLNQTQIYLLKMQELTNLMVLLKVKESAVHFLLEISKLAKNTNEKIKLRFEYNDDGTQIFHEFPIKRRPNKFTEKSLFSKIVVKLLTSLVVV